MYVLLYTTISILQQKLFITLRWSHHDRDGVSNRQPHNCLLNHLFRRRSKKTSKLHVTGLCAGNSPVTGEFPAQRASNAENVSIWWCHHKHDNFSPKSHNRHSIVHLYGWGTECLLLVKCLISILYFSSPCFMWYCCRGFHCMVHPSWYFCH